MTKISETTEAIIEKHNLPRRFPKKVWAAAEQAVENPGPDGLRADFCALLTITIDGSDARDLDDALSLSKTEEGNWLLGVHIADVAHYVKAGSPLDAEADLRGTSVYFPDCVLPMLPPALSNGICSLNAGEERLALSCMMEIGPRGEVLSHQLYESRIRVDYRLSYEQVNAALEDKDKAALQALKPVLPMLRQLKKLTAALRRRRERGGALDFDFPESKVILDADGRVLDIQQRRSRIGERMIEDAMIAANQTVAADFRAREIPFVYRVHQACSADRLWELNENLQPLGYFIRAKKGQGLAAAMREQLHKAAGQPEERLVSTLVLRSMQHAFYTVEPLGHFALGMDAYCHFTSPIRRYPDLLVHRQIKKWLKRRKLHAAEYLAEAAARSSYRERLAETAERDAVAAFSCLYMADKLGEIFDGHISGVTGYGLYVELANGVEGLLHIRYLEDDYYIYHESQLALRGRDRHKTYRLGDPIRVQLKHVDCDRYYIDFILPPMENDGEVEQ